MVFGPLPLQPARCRRHCVSLRHAGHIQERYDVNRSQEAGPVLARLILRQSLDEG